MTQLKKIETKKYRNNYLLQFLIVKKIQNKSQNFQI